MKNFLAIITVIGVVAAGATSSAFAAGSQEQQAPAYATTYDNRIARNGDEAIRLQGGGTAPHNLSSNSSGHEHGRSR